MGTLISLERAQALRNPLAYLAPALLGAGSLALIAGAPALLAQTRTHGTTTGRNPS